MENSNIICGRNPVLEALRSGREIDRLLVAHGTGGGSVTAIIAKCRAKGILIKEISPQKLDYYCGGANYLDALFKRRLVAVQTTRAWR